MADDVAEMVRALRAQMDQAESLHTQVLARIWVTYHVPPGLMVEAPYLDRDGRETGLRQVLVNPNDWAQVEALANQQGSDRVIEAFGIPVIKDRELKVFDHEQL